jgi:hypothetical protein
MGMIYRNDVRLRAKSSASAGNGGGKGSNGEQTDDTD